MINIDVGAATIIGSHAMCRVVGRQFRGGASSGPFVLFLFMDLSAGEALHDVSHIILDWFTHGQAPDRVVVKEVFGWLYNFTLHSRYPNDSTAADNALAYERRGEFKAEALIKCPCES